MDRVLPARQSWPFAANSTGRFLGSLNGRTLRRINCWEATGPARVEFAQSIQPKIITHLRENSDKLQESDNIVNLSLFMVGTSIQRTKPTIIFVSNDKATRREAYKLVKDSGILQDHPKFEIGHCPLVAEFEDFRQMGDPKIFGMDANLFALDTVPVDIFSNATYDLDGALLFALSADDVINYASAGGIVSFHGNQMVLTVNHFLPGTTVDRSVQRHPSNTTIEDDTEYEITGLEDPDGDDDDEELVSATSHGSLSPVLSVSDHENEDVGRKPGHVRSAIESTITAPGSADNSVMGSEEDTDEGFRYKPEMVRKKSGELVRPALRASRRRPTGMPGTSFFSKAVHFDSHLEHIRYFLQVDRPFAVSAGSSPVETYESDGEYPFPGNGKHNVRMPPFEWELVTANFPPDSHHRRMMPARLEKVWLSVDQKSLLGSIAVANLAFHKQVACRFTLDYWQTVSEVAAEYSHEIRPRETPMGYDRFTFSIKLSDLANLEAKTLFFCIRYSVNDQEFWDNNNSTNFQVDFRKKHLPQNGTNSFGGAASRPVNDLPRSRNRRHNSPSTLRPVSMPVSLDAFGSEPNKLALDHPIHEYLGESGLLRLQTKSTSNLARDNIASNLKSPNGVAFSNRYDFGASLNAALRVAKDSAAKDRDTLYTERNVRDFGPTLGVPDAATSPSSSSDNSRNRSLSPSPSPRVSYEELVNKYCFIVAPMDTPPTPTYFFHSTPPTPFDTAYFIRHRLLHSTPPTPFDTAYSIRHRLLHSTPPTSFGRFSRV
ncbi:protein phosphatase regulator [Purpureocillium lavendulum]|uniref:Protein phosphatase regulator n=1 Tax=Purpureocillium lavendulum TaxID=1247861 RepID=A0AB34FF03_9HYPO|nr:protein phosphatase regulator [Purpureocillium lavendulum]